MASTQSLHRSLISRTSGVGQKSFHRHFRTTPSQLSRIGRSPIAIPSEVQINVLSPESLTAKHRSGSSSRAIATPKVQVKGPLGELSLNIPLFIKLRQDLEARKAYVEIQDESDPKQKAMWGTTRAYIANHVLGVSEGHITILRLVGVGFRATVEPLSNVQTIRQEEYPGQKFVSLKVGYSHPIELPVPLGVTATTPQPTRILLEGAEKEVVKSFAAKIREWRVPEPYKGKGIFIDDETIKLKGKKIK